MSRRIIPLLATAAAVAVLAGCTGTQPAPSDSSSSVGEPVSGGTLRVALAAAANCLDPQQAGGDNEISVLRDVVDSLTHQDRETGEIGPWLATEWTVNEDSTQYVFTIRHGVTFSDGTDLTASIVADNVSSLVENAGSWLTAAAAGFESVTADDAASTVTIDFSTPNASFLQATSQPQFGILSASSLAADSDDRCAGVDLVGSGPFTIEEVVPDTSYTLVRRDGYDWAWEGAPNAGEAYLDAVEYLVTPENGVRTGLLTSGEVDVASGLTPADESTVEGAGFPLLSSPTAGAVLSLWPNVSHGVLADPVVRTAVQESIDRAEIHDALLSSSYQLVTSVIGSPTPGWADFSDELALDAEAAGGALDEAGWTVGPDGIREKDGEKLSFAISYITGFTPVADDLVALVKTQLAANGIDAQLTPIQTADFLNLQAAGSYDVLLGNFSRPDPDVLRNLFSIDTQNYPFLAQPDAELEAALTAQLGEPDPDARAAIVSDIQSQLIDKGYSFPLYEGARVLATAANVHGLAIETYLGTSVAGAWIAQD